MGCINTQPVHAVPDGDFYDGSWLAGKKHSNNSVSYRWKDGSEYFGPFVDDFMNGSGTFRASSGATYTGNFNRNQFDGTGKLQESNGDFYEALQGTFQNGLREGFGVQVIKQTGERYEGHWQQNLRHGNGNLLYHEDAYGRIEYQGLWAENKKRGHGKLTFVNNGLYNGEFLDDMYHGKGRWQLPDGVVFEGTFEKNCLVNGKISYLDGSFYEGQLRDHLPSGKGRLERPSGLRYYGQWQNGKKHGHGTLTYPNGSIFTGPFAEDLRIDGEAQMNYPDGSVYCGEFKSEKPHGNGKFTEPNENRFEGLFSEGLMHGAGVMFFLCDADGIKLAEPQLYHGRTWVAGVCQTHSSNFRSAALRLGAAELRDFERDAAAALDKLRRDSVTNDRLCSACHAAEINTIFLECAHCVCCEECATKLVGDKKPCPACSAKLTRVVRTFHS